MVRAVLFDELGGPEVLRIHDLPIGEPGPGELRIRVDAIGLNRGEALFRRGSYYELPELPASRIGTESAGVVEAVGAGVDGFAPGDAVCTLPAFSMRDYGVYAERAIVPARAVLHRPDGLDAVTAAAVWTAYVTAYGALVDVARLGAGDTVLITAAASTVGLAAIQVANHLGAVPIATTRAGAKRRRLLDAGAAEVIVTGEDDLVQRVLDATGGRGAELAFDCVAGPGIHELARAVVPDGRLIVYGWLDEGPVPLPLRPDFRGVDTRFHAMFDISTDPERLRRAERFITAGLRSGSFRPHVDRTFDLDEITEAHRRLESDRQFGKIVATVRH
ncbi:zinc-dependent alcohol dehydrogenase family protein [Allonocardiopsis opalescens]|uniref:NADPH:quinone reductase-like Zn-dependent oxidoreductase n=1 Tax=Allonocardiopsis opalescens TaxID=1144618 RepID=A0A2T0PYR7_9ACTN|nr:zinc-dependent alcohol dehydrogenase family protein [Allonocardiopsis opalescens]PRX96652.1 NADPH:quinone reductase-like Zn-dependent oxidoreductase [Allonocardiopsis opalescens]